MRLSSILLVAFALALPMSAQAGSKSGGNSKTSVTSGRAAKQQPSYVIHRGATAVGPRGGVYH
jgi:hypothetical protein